MVTYVSLTQSKSTLVKGVAKRMLQVRRSDVFIDNSYHCLYSFFFHIKPISFQILKDNINFRLTGLASSVLREKMIKSILSDKFPSAHNCNMYVPEARGAEAEEGDAAEGECQDSCPSP